MTPARHSASQGGGRPASARRTPNPGGASWASSDAVRRRMQRQQTRDTSPELSVRRILHARGLRYRVDAAPLKTLRRRADLVFGPAKVAVFIDGCFWHGCPEHGARPSTANRAYWSTKIERNRRRDAETDALLTQAGWLVVRAWEHQDSTSVANLVEQAVRGRRPPHTADEILKPYRSR